jgi:hypothetical protein
MKKITSIIGEVGPTYAHLIKEFDRCLAIRSQRNTCYCFFVKARANVNVSVIPSVIGTVTVIHFGNGRCSFVRKFSELNFVSRNSGYSVFQDDPGERHTILHDHQILTVKECIRVMENMKALLYGGRVQNTLSKIPV